MYRSFDDYDDIYYENSNKLQIILKQVKILPHIPSHITHINVSWNDIKELKIPEHIKHLNASYCLIRFIHTPLNENLIHLNVDANYLVELPDLPNSLKFLSVKGNHIHNIPKLPPNLKHASLSGNPILKCPELPENLTYIDIDTTCICKLPKLPNSLQYLFCAHNFINTLPELSSNLTHLYCSSNLISTLPSSLPSTLKVLDIAYNTKLSNLPKLPNQLEKLYINHTNISYIPKLPSSIYVLNCTSMSKLVYVYSIKKYSELCPVNLRNLAATRIQRSYLRYYTKRLCAAKKIKDALHNYLWKPPHGINIKLGYRSCLLAIKNHYNS